MKFLTLTLFLLTLFTLPAFGSTPEKGSFTVKDLSFDLDFQKIQGDLVQQRNLEPVYQNTNTFGIMCSSIRQIKKSKHQIQKSLGKTNSIPLTKYAYFLFERWLV